MDVHSELSQTNEVEKVRMRQSRVTERRCMTLQVLETWALYLQLWRSGAVNVRKMGDMEDYQFCLIDKYCKCYEGIEADEFASAGRFI